jgi:hypothetical protein
LYLPSLGASAQKLKLASTEVVAGRNPSPPHPIQWEVGMRGLTSFAAGEGGLRHPVYPKRLVAWKRVKRPLVVEQRRCDER